MKEPYTGCHLHLGAMRSMEHSPSSEADDASANQENTKLPYGINESTAKTVHKNDFIESAPSYTRKHIFILCYKLVRKTVLTATSVIQQTAVRCFRLRKNGPLRIHTPQFLKIHLNIFSRPLLGLPKLVSLIQVCHRKYRIVSLTHALRNHHIKA
jgi:hypothetical protein